MKDSEGVCLPVGEDGGGGGDSSTSEPPLVVCCSLVDGGKGGLEVLEYLLKNEGRVTGMVSTYDGMGFTGAHWLAAVNR